MVNTTRRSSSSSPDSSNEEDTESYKEFVGVTILHCWIYEIFDAL